LTKSNSYLPYKKTIKRAPIHKWWISRRIKEGVRFEPQAYRDISRIQIWHPTPNRRERCRLWMDTTKHNRNGTLCLGRLYLESLAKSICPRRNRTAKNIHARVVSFVRIAVL